ncbi:MAG TPA: FAD binding domain-containing protein [Xanthobacteraceae bacterium]|nr:FAD binding domain-containing protein [Xanthobacteraceae bacterium]
MKAAAFEYARADSLAEAIKVLGSATKAGQDAQVMAGGQSLLAMMNLRVSSPDLLIDISRIEELRVVLDESDAIRFGACVTHAAIEDRAMPDPSRGLMPMVAGKLAYRAVRTRGTLGGSLALSDPAGDWVTVMQAIGAQVGLVGDKGRREVEALGFTTGLYETARAPNEIIESVRIPKLSAAARWGFSKFCRKSGEFAHSIAAVVVDPERDFARIVLGGSGAAPMCLERASQSLLQRAALQSVERAAEGDLANRDDAHDEFQRSVHGATISRALSQVLS